MSHYVVTGGAGFIGSAIVRRLLAEGAGRVVVIDNLLTGKEINLEDVRGKIDFFDRLERVSSQTLLDLLKLPQRNRTAGTFRRLSKLMTELGWTAVRVRDLTRGGYKEQVRGYCRDARNLQPSH